MEEKGMNVLNPIVPDSSLVQESNSVQTTSSLGIVKKMSELSGKIADVVKQAFPITFTIETEWVTPPQDGGIFSGYNRSRVEPAPLAERSQTEDSHQEEVEASSQESVHLNEEEVEVFSAQEEISSQQSVDLNGEKAERKKHHHKKADKVKKEKKSITDEAAIELYKRIGGNIFLLQSEVNKLVSFSYPQDSIEKSHVTQLIGEYVQENIFDFLQAFKQKNSSLTLHLLNRFFLQGKEPLMINNMLSREVRILFSLKLAGPKITSEKACSYIFKGKRQYSSFHLRKAKEYIEAAKKFTVPQLIFAQRRVLNAEFSIKKGKEKPDIAIQKALISIIEKTSLKI